MTESIITSSNANGTPYLQVADDLKALPQWLLWQRRMIKGKWRKVPLNPQNLKVAASPTNPANTDSR